MIYIYGDSHASFSFNNLTLQHMNLHCSSITMHRIGRDNIIIHFDKNTIQPNDTIVLSYGEVDCRCHIQRQINLGKHEDDVIYELVNQYITTIYQNTKDLNLHIIIVGVIPPTKQSDYESIHGPILHEFPFVGTDEDRVRYTRKVNELLEQLSIQYGYLYFNPYDYYTRSDGTLKHELSDTIVHLQDNQYFLNQFIEFYQKKIIA